MDSVVEVVVAVIVCLLDNFEELAEAGAVVVADTEWNVMVVVVGAEDVIALAVDIPVLVASAVDKEVRLVELFVGWDKVAPHSSVLMQYLEVGSSEAPAAEGIAGNVVAVTESLVLGQQL